MAAGIAPPVAGRGTTQAPTSNTRYGGPLAVLASLFFMFGFLTCLNDILTPHLKAIFDLSYAQAMTTQFAFFTAYFVVSPPVGKLIQRVGYKNGLIVGLITAGIGCLLFYPAAAQRVFGLFLFALLVLASGITAIQVSANAFVTALGDPATASSRLTLTQAFNSLGTTIAPLFGSFLILATQARSPSEVQAMSTAQAEAYRLAEAHSVQLPYLGFAATLLATAAIVFALKLPRVEPLAEEGAIHPGSLFRQRHLVLGALGIFAYVGAEVAIGSFLVNYLKEPQIAGLTESVAARYVAYYWGAAMVGRFVGIATLRRFKPRHVLLVHALGAGALVLATVLTHGSAAMWAVLAVGFFNSIMFPTIFTLGLHGLGTQTGQGSGILCMAIVGGAIVPVLQGLLADAVGVHHSFILPAVCYAYIAWFALRGSTRTRVTT